MIIIFPIICALIVRWENLIKGTVSIFRIKNMAVKKASFYLVTFKT